jgi:hypothetical protein
MKGDSLINLNAFLFYLYRMFSSTRFVYATFSSTLILYYLKDYLTLGCGRGASTGGPPSSPTNAKLSAASHQTFVVNSSSSLESERKENRVFARFFYNLKTTFLVVFATNLILSDRAPYPRTWLCGRGRSGLASSCASPPSSAVGSERITVHRKSIISLQFCRLANRSWRID